MVDTQNGSLTKISNVESLGGSWTAFDVFDDHVLSVFSAPNQTPTLMIAKLPAAGDERNIDWTAIEAVDQDSVSKSLLAFSWRIATFKREGKGEFKVLIKIVNQHFKDIHNLISRRP